MNTNKLYPRFASERLKEALADTPIVLIHGPRQCGKTTLARTFAEPLGYTYFSFDDPVLSSAVESDPIGFVDELPEKVILDEVQHVPGIFPIIKKTVDRNRIPGRFLLTGSANVLLVPKLSESLSGRMEILRLHPLAQCELAGEKSSFLKKLFSGSFKIQQVDRLGRRLHDLVVGGGYPPAISRPNSRRRTAWYRDYIETLTQRDVRDLARIRSLHILPKLLELTTSQTSTLLNVSGLSSPFQLTRPTIREYLTLLESVFLVEELLPRHSNRASRLIKTPKLHMVDTGLACMLLGFDSTGFVKNRTAFGPLLETFIFQELKRQASWHEDNIRFYHFRDKDNFEVDIVLERNAYELAGIEVKASATVNATDFRGLRKLKDIAQKRFTCGVVFYDGTTIAGFGDKMYAIPIRLLWETT
jgi:predicted AAA+ superfamily ATPase